METCNRRLRKPSTAWWRAQRKNTLKCKDFAPENQTGEGMVQATGLLTPRPVTPAPSFDIGWRSASAPRKAHPIKTRLQCFTKLKKRKEQVGTARKEAGLRD